MLTRERRSYWLSYTYVSDFGGGGALKVEVDNLRVLEVLLNMHFL
jgi:hypothetical protein